MTVKEKFTRGLHAVKYGTIGAISGALLMGGVIIPVGGLVAHGAKYAGEETLAGYSLRNRFETAYSFNTPESHKYYYSTPIVNGYAQETCKEEYFASPYATYGATAGAGLAGAILLGGAGIVMAKRKEKQR